MEECLGCGSTSSIEAQVRASTAMRGSSLMTTAAIKQHGLGLLGSQSRELSPLSDHAENFRQQVATTKHKKVNKTKSKNNDGKGALTASSEKPIAMPSSATSPLSDSAGPERNEAEIKRWVTSMAEFLSPFLPLVSDPLQYQLLLSFHQQRRSRKRAADDDAFLEKYAKKLDMDGPRLDAVVDELQRLREEVKRLQEQRKIELAQNKIGHDAVEQSEEQVIQQLREKVEEGYNDIEGMDKLEGQRNELTSARQETIKAAEAWLQSLAE